MRSRRGPTSASGSPFASAAATGAKRSRPWNVLLPSGRKSASFSTECAVPSPTSVSNPLSGARKIFSSRCSATIFRSVPTPGSTTQTKIVPAGQYATIVLRNPAASTTSYGAMSCARSYSGAGVRAAITPFIAATYGSRVPKSVMRATRITLLNILGALVPNRPSAAATPPRLRAIAGARASENAPRVGHRRRARARGVRGHVARADRVDRRLHARNGDRAPLGADAARERRGAATRVRASRRGHADRTRSQRAAGDGVFRALLLSPRREDHRHRRRRSGAPTRADRSRLRAARLLRVRSRSRGRRRLLPHRLPRRRVRPGDLPRHRVGHAARAAGDARDDPRHRPLARRAAGAIRH